MTTVVLVGTLDTKGEEYRWIHDQLAALGCEVTSVNVGTFSDAAGPGDISSSEVAAAAGEDLAALRAGNDRGAAMDAMGRGAAAVVGRLFSQGTPGRCLRGGRIQRIVRRRGRHADPARRRAEAARLDHGLR